MNIMDFFKPKKESNIVEVIPFFRNYLKTTKRGAEFRHHYKSVVNHLDKYQQSRGITLMSNQFDYQTIEDFVDYLYDLNLMKNTIVSILQKTKSLLHKMQNQGIEVNQSFNDFRLFNEETSSTYLTSEEIERFYNFQLHKEHLRIIRDVFVIGCLTGMRYSDYSKLTKENISGDFIVRKTKKTGSVVTIPIHRIIREILQRNGGSFPLYKDTSQNFNAIIKKLCRKVGIEGDVLWERTVGRKIVRKKIPRWKMICSHTARRSFATNAYLAGIPTARIMLMTGHKTESAFFAYIRITKKENAKVLSDHPFFNN